MRALVVLLIGLWPALSWAEDDRHSRYALNPPIQDGPIAADTRPMRVLVFLLIGLWSALGGAEDNRHSRYALSEKLVLPSAGEPVVLLKSPAQTQGKAEAKGNLLLVPDGNDAVSSAGPLLALRTLLADAGWQVYVLMGRPAAETELPARIAQALRGLPPATKTGAGTVKTPVIVLVQGDSLPAVLTLLKQQPALVQGLVLLSAYQPDPAATTDSAAVSSSTSRPGATGGAEPAQAAAPELPPASLPILDLVAAQDHPPALYGATQRRAQWRELTRYRRYQMVNADHQFTAQEAWLSRIIVGWLRSVSAGAPGKTER